MDLLEVKDAALSYLEPAEKEIMQWFQGDFKVELKPDQSPVTIADKNAEEILRRKISTAFPDHGIIGEEFGNEKADAEWVWTIDPLDGTRSFVRGIPLFASLLALLHHGEPVMGIISLPALQETSWAVRGEGAYCGERKLQVSPQKQLAEAVVATADYYCFEEKKFIHVVERLHQRAKMVRTYPDAFGHLLAIRGAVDVMVDPWAYIWDYAPCKILAEEAGGAFENFTGDKNSIAEGTAIVGNPQLVQAVRGLI